MHIRTKRAAVVLLLLLFAALLLPGLPWSARSRHKIRRLVVRAELKISELRGNEPRLISIAGETGLPGARVEVLDSHSGWASLCDKEGRFSLPDLLWYPCATFHLVLSAADNEARMIKIATPASVPPEGILNVGMVSLDHGQQVDAVHLPGISSITYDYFDLENRDYYKALYDELTQNKASHEERLDAVNEYIAGKLNYGKSDWHLESPRQAIEEGSRYCGHLSTAMATILAGGYLTRIINLTDGGSPPNTHMVVEVFYDRGWHLYDPTFGVRFKNRKGEVASYQELRIEPELISEDLFSGFRHKFPRSDLSWMRGLYSTGYHHFYYLAFRCFQHAHAFWAYKDGLEYVPPGGRILLAAAGIRPGSTVTFHIRKPGSSVDELIFRTRRAGNSVCVLNEEDSPRIDLGPGTYDVFADFQDGNVSASESTGSAAITNWRLSKRLEIRATAARRRSRHDGSS